MVLPIRASAAIASAGYFLELLFGILGGSIMQLSAWHYEIDTLPRFNRTSNGDYDLLIPVGVYPYTRERVNVIMEFRIDNAGVERIGFNRNNRHGVITSITGDFISCLKLYEPDSLRHYLNMAPSIRSNTNLYYEGVIKGIPENSKVEYRASVFPKSGLATHTPWYAVYMKETSFGFNDIKFMTAGDDSAERTHAIYYKEDALFHHIRVDYVDISGDVPRDFVLRINNIEFSLRDKGDLPFLPIINTFHDYVTLSFPKSFIPYVRNLIWQGNNIDLTRATNVGKARIMLIHYCMQGLNDLFEAPNKNYAPYRSYIQTTMRDELATYSSRPNSTEVNEEDGYMFTIDNHRKYGIKHLWTFNAGVFSLIAQDCPEDLAQIRRDIAGGIFDLTIAGFGGHRLPYYQEETNRYSIQYGIDMMNNIAGACNNVYYLDQRLYKQMPNVFEALRKANVKYIVVDASTGFEPHRWSIKGNNNAFGLYLDHHYLWQDELTGLYILYIDDEMRNKMLGSSKYEYSRGKLAMDLRKKLLYFASHPDIRGNNLIIYSDDADKASGNGWFDGDYSGNEPEFCDMFKAGLEWIAAHPWIEAVSSADINPGVDCVGTIDMKDAICPSVDPGGSTSIDTYGKSLHFDAWYDNWKNFRAVWIDKTLEEISQDIEYSIINWPAQYHNQLYELGKMHFSMSLHESQWNKQPLEFEDPNRRSDVIEPEDFVIAASLQIRNAQVYLNAAVWAEWAKSHSQDKVYINTGPVIDTLKQLGVDEKGTGTYWDKDVLQNIIMYNRHVLVVMDQNGGRITHIFIMKNGKPFCVSGTMKCYQYLTDEKIMGENVICDGEVLQNTVYTPNHSYVACDLRESRASGVMGWKLNPKTGVNRDLDCYYPDNFNAYEYIITPSDTVEWVYRKTIKPPRPLTLELFRALLRQDSWEKEAGQPGVIFHPMPDFRKTISLAIGALTLRYYGTSPGHITANEFSMDLFSNLMFNKKNIRSMPNPSTIRLENAAGLTVDLSLAGNCAFSEHTLEGDKNLRLHRTLTDSIEVECQNGGDFSYRIEFA